MKNYVPEISDEVHRAHQKGETFIMMCEETPDNPDWQEKCEAMKKRAIEMNNKYYFSKRIDYTQYDDTSCAHKRSGCELNFNNNPFVTFWRLKGKWFE